MRGSPRGGISLADRDEALSPVSTADGFGQDVNRRADIHGAYAHEPRLQKATAASWRGPA